MERNYNLPSVITLNANNNTTIDVSSTDMSGRKSRDNEHVGPTPLDPYCHATATAGDLARLITDVPFNGHLFALPLFIKPSLDKLSRSLPTISIGIAVARLRPNHQGCHLLYSRGLRRPSLTYCTAAPRPASGSPAIKQAGDTGNK